MDTKAAQEALTQEKEQLRGQMQSIGQENPALPGEWEPLPPTEVSEPDPLDRAEALTSQEDAAAVLADLGARYASVKEALARIESGTYGVCAVCSEPIEPARLAADSAATTCIRHR